MPPQGTSGNTSAIYVLLRYLVDQKSEAAVKKSLAFIRGSGADAVESQKRTYQELDKLFQTLAKDIEKIQDPEKLKAFTADFLKLKAAAQGMMTATIGMPNQANYPDLYERVAARVKTATQAIKEQQVAEQQATKASREHAQVERERFKEAFRYGIGGRTLTRFGQSMQLFGQTLLSPIKMFTDLQVKTDPVFRRWETASNRMSGAFARIGRTMLQTMLPAIEKMSKIIDRIARFVEEHPWLAGFIAIAGGITIGLGKLMVSVGQLLVGLSAFHAAKGLVQGTAIGDYGEGAEGIAMALRSIGPKFAAFALMLKEAGTALLGFITNLGKILFSAVTSIPGAVVAGILAGFAANEALSKTEAGKKAGIQPFGKIATVAAYGVGKIFSEETALNWARKVAVSFGYVEKSAEEAARANMTLAEQSEAGGQRIAQYYQQIADSHTGAVKTIAEFWVWLWGGTKKATEAAEAFDEQWALIAEDATKLYQSFAEAEEKAKRDLNDNLTKVDEEYAQKSLENEQKYEQDRVDEQEQYAQKRVDIEVEYEKDRTRLIEDYNKDRAKREEDFLRQQARAVEDFARETVQRIADEALQEQRLTEDMQERLADLDQGYYDNLEKARQDHLRRLEQLERDHQFNVDELVAKRDMGGLIDEQRRYDKEKAEEDSNYNDRIADLKDSIAKERQAIQEDYQRRLAEMKAQFALEEQRRKEDFQRKQEEEKAEKALDDKRAAEDQAERLADLAARFKEEQEQAAEQHKDRLKELEKNYNDEITQLKDAKAKERQTLATEYEKDRQQRLAQLKQDMSDLLGIVTPAFAGISEAAKAMAKTLLEEQKKLEDAAAGGSTAPAKATGGYVTGLIRTGEQGPEYLLNNSTTSALESMLGGRLTQAGVVQALVASRRNVASRGPQQISVYNRIDFHGALSDMERSALRKEMRAVTRDGILDALGA
jgi:hypothetical protein